jgi:hypothetical protein
MSCWTILASEFGKVHSIGAGICTGPILEPSEALKCRCFLVMAKSRVRRTRVPVSGELPRHEWDFEDRKALPDEELDACFLHEFGREFAKTSPKLKRVLARLSRIEQLPKGHPARANWVDLFKKANEIVGWHMVLLETSVFPQTPWQDLPASWRKKWASAVSKSVQAPALKQSLCLTLRLLRDFYPEELLAQQKEGTPEPATLKKVLQYAELGSALLKEWMVLDACAHGAEDQRDYGFIAINWNYTNDELSAHFRRWLVQARGNRSASEDKRGTNRKRQHLKALGAKRLLDAEFTAEEAMRFTATILTDTHGNPRPLYGALRSWYEARNVTVPEVLNLLFPAPPQAS